MKNALHRDIDNMSEFRRCGFVVSLLLVFICIAPALMVSVVLFLLPLVGFDLDRRFAFLRPAHKVALPDLLLQRLLAQVALHDLRMRLLCMVDLLQVRQLRNQDGYIDGLYHHITM